METRKNHKIGSRSEQAFMDNKTEARAIEEWLRIVDKPLSQEHKDANNAKPSD